MSVAVGEEDVAGCDVAMQHSLAMRVGERFGHLPAEPHHVGDRQRALARDPILERLTLDVGHHVERELVEESRVVQRDDVRVAQSSHHTDLPREALHRRRIRQLATQDLERHRPVHQAVVGEIHRGHAPAAEHPLDDIPPGDERPARRRGTSGLVAGSRGVHGWMVRVESPIAHGDAPLVEGAQS